MTESPRKNLEQSTLDNHVMMGWDGRVDWITHILLMKRSLFTPLPFPPLGFSVHISFTFSSTMLQWRSKALTRARSCASPCQ